MDDVPVFPPEDHLLRDLGIVTHRLSPTRTLSATSLDRSKLDRTGRPAVGFLSALVDINAAQVALLASQPRWTATTALTLHASGRAASGTLVSDAQLVRIGSNLIVVRTSVHDGGSTNPDELLDALATDGDCTAMPRIAAAVLTFGRIPAEASVASATYDPSTSPARSRLESSAAPRFERLAYRLGTRVTAPGMIEMQPSAYTRNSFGTVFGGAYGMLFQAAGESLDPGLVATDLEVQYLSQTEAGPVVVRAEVVRDDQHGVVCEVAAMVGAKTLSIGSVTLARPVG
ncbi:MAG: hypothetical protein JWL72_251 [Ilumatobacteraceae bacterium]|nr:hypothetical protein [Ilumatobacteraceae bacterium]